MAEPSHQLFHAGAGRGGQGSADMPQIVKVQIRRTRLGPGGMPYRAEAGPAQRGAFRADEHQAARTRLGEPLQMPAQLWDEITREGNDAPTRVRLRRLRDQVTAIELGGRLHDPDLALPQVGGCAYGRFRNLK